MQSIRLYKGISPTLAAGVYVDPAACVIGDVKLGEQVGIWPMAVIRGDVNRVEIGARSNVQDGAVLHVTRVSPQRPDGFPLLIGEDVTIGHKAMLHGCRLADRILVGMGAILLDGVEVESDVIIAAGTLVPPGKKLVSGYLYMGNPMRQARPLTEDEYAFFTRSAANYVQLKDEYLAEQIQ